MSRLLHPLSFLPLELRQPVFWFSLALTVACFAVFQAFLDPPLKTSVSTGVVSFELARTPEVSTAMVASWDARARQFAAFGLGFDFLFMPVYATALSAGLLLAAGRLRGAWSALGNLLGWGAYLATLFDAVENLALFSILNGSVGANPALAFGCACLKFGLLLFGLGYALLAWLVPAK